MAHHRYAIILFVVLFLWLVLVSSSSGQHEQLLKRRTADSPSSSAKNQRFRNGQQRLTRGRDDWKNIRSLSDMELIAARGYGKRASNNIHNANNFLLEWIASRGLMGNRGLFPREELQE